MDKENHRFIERTLGIYPPWRITDVLFNDIDNKVDVTVEHTNKTSRLSFFSNLGSKSQQTGAQNYWIHSKIGHYQAVIHAQIPTQETSPTQGVDEHIASLPSFLGHPTRHYSNQIRQEIAVSLLRGVDIKSLESLYSIPADQIRHITKDLDTLPPQMETLSYLPTENALVWKKLLNDKFILRTDSLPLKMLISKLKLEISRSSGKQTNQDYWNAANELKQFFIVNANSLSSEVQQLCGIDSRKAATASNAKRKAKLVLPAIKSHIWIDILSGKLSLNSQSIALNLLIASQRNAFVNSNTSPEKLAAVSTIREYFLKNYRKLKPELLLINRALAIHKKSRFKLPNEEHEVWRKILHDEDFITSNHMAYQLLLSKLRTQIKLHRDPVVEIEAARSIRNFLAQNQHSMKNELSQMFRTANTIKAS